jgi:hypothetical protein
VKISQAIHALEHLKSQHGDVEVFADCEKCQHATPVGIVVPVEERVTARLQRAIEKLPPREPDFR